MIDNSTVTPSHEKALAIIAEELELEVSDFTLTGHFVDDYDADSLALIAVVARIEKEVGVAIPKTDLMEMINLAAVFELIDRYENAPVGVAERG